MLRLLTILALCLTASSVSAQSAYPQTAPDRGPGDIVLPGSRVPQCLARPGPQIIEPCDEGEELILWDQPVLDEDDLFIVCTKQVPFCVPEGLDPAGIAPGGGSTIRDFVAVALDDGRPLPDALIALAGGDGGALEDTTITCNDDTHICTCTSTHDGDCEPKLAALCDDAIGWSDGGVGENCPSTDGE